jgi:HSP20 family protein
MTLIRWSPAPLTALRDITSIQDEVNRLFDGFFTRGAMRGDLASVFTPAVDIEETPEEFVVRADLPGVAQKDVKVSLMGDTLTLRGERRHDNATKDGSHLRRERVHGTFERSFILGTAVHNDRIKAQCRDGVLEVRVPKAEEARMREIEVQVG